MHYQIKGNKQFSCRPETEMDLSVLMVNGGVISLGEEHQIVHGLRGKEEVLEAADSLISICNFCRSLLLPREPPTTGGQLRVGHV